MVGEDRYLLISPTRFMGGTDDYHVVPVTTVRIVKDEGSVIVPMKGSAFVKSETVDSPDFLTSDDGAAWLNRNNDFYKSNSAFGQ